MDQLHYADDSSSSPNNKFEFVDSKVFEISLQNNQKGTRFEFERDLNTHQDDVDVLMSQIDLPSDQNFRIERHLKDECDGSDLNTPQIGKNVNIPSQSIDNDKISKITVCELQDFKDQKYLLHSNKKERYEKLQNFNEVKGTDFNSSVKKTEPVFQSSLQKDESVSLSILNGLHSDSDGVVFLMDTHKFKE